MAYANPRKKMAKRYCSILTFYVKREVHQHAIECDTDEGNAEEFPHLPLLDFQPIEIEQDTEVHAGEVPTYTATLWSAPPAG